MRGRPPRWRDDQAPSLLSLVDMFNERIPDLPGCPENLMAVLRAGMANEEADRPSAIELRDLLIGLRLEPPPPVVAPPPVAPVPLPKAAQTPPVAPDRILASPFMAGEASADPEQTVQHAVEAPWLGGGPPPVGPPVDGVILDTPQRPPGARKFMLIVAAVVLLVVGLAGAGIAYNLNAGPGPGPTKSPSTAPTSAQSQAAGAVACPPTVTKLARCSPTVECLDADKQAVPCAGVHTWEVFAYGDLAKGSQVKTGKDSPVDEVCSFKTLLLLDLRTVNWRVDALLPALSEQQAGPTVFRCLAGNPPSTFTGQQLHVSKTSPAPSGAGRRS
ncbi:hypothetical protein GCM10027610_126440 [Dactylosporangium cerinum]